MWSPNGGDDSFLDPHTPGCILVVESQWRVCQLLQPLPGGETVALTVGPLPCHGKDWDSHLSGKQWAKESPSKRMCGTVQIDWDPRQTIPGYSSLQIDALDVQSADCAFRSADCIFHSANCVSQQNRITALYARICSLQNASAHCLQPAECNLQSANWKFRRMCLWLSSHSADW